MVTQEDSKEEAIRKVGLEKLLTIGEIIDKYYRDLLEVLNEEIAKTLPQHRPYDCKIDLEPDAPLYKGAISTTSSNREKKKPLKEYIYENLVKVSSVNHNLQQVTLLVPKKSGELRLFMDYRKLNQLIKIKRLSPIPRINSAFETMKGAVALSKFNLKSAYNLVRIRERD